MQDFLFEWLSGAGAEAAVFASAFISSTLMPGGSEALLAGALSQTPDDTPRLCRLVLLATAGNTLGAMTTWLIGRLIPEREKTDRALVWLRRWGAPALLLSWLPVVGDALPLAAGLAQDACCKLCSLGGRGKASALRRRGGGHALACLSRSA